MPDIETNVADSVATLRLTRPETLNALRWETFEAIIQAITDLSGRTDVRALVITGSGRAFSSGAGGRSTV